MAPPGTLSPKPQGQGLRVFQVPRQFRIFLLVASDNPGAVVPIVVAGGFAVVVLV